MRWTDEGHRKTHRCRDPTSFSTTDQLCGMRLLSPTRKLCVLPGAAHCCASPSNRSLLPPSSTPCFAILLSIPLWIDPVMAVWLWVLPPNSFVMGSGMYVQHSGCVEK